MVLLNKIKEKTKEIRPEMERLSKYIYDNPELGNEEYLSSKAHVDLLKSRGFSVEYPYLGIDTAFKAIYKSDKPGPTIAFLSEYDALPGIGHGCGHNLLGSTTTTAGIVLKELIDQHGGSVVVLGTPAEETNGAKVTMAESNTFNDIDIAMCTHPHDSWQASGTSMAMEALEFEFFGKTSHAAAAPHMGRNALDAAVGMYINVSMYRQQLHHSARVHGIIKDGGQAANVIPEYARNQYYIRAMTMAELTEIRTRIIDCAQAAARAANCDMKYNNYELSYHNLITNQTLSNRFNENMVDLGVYMITEERDGMGSLDMGNVSQKVPVINPYFSMTDGQKLTGHTVDFREATITGLAKDNAELMVQGLVYTSLQLIDDKELLEAVKREFNNTNF